MQKGIVAYNLINEGWDVSEHIGDGYDLVAIKNGTVIKIELKAIDLACIKKGNRVTQHLSVHEIASATHLIVSVFDGINLKNTYFMSIEQFYGKSRSKKCRKQHGTFKEFHAFYKKKSEEQLKITKGFGKKKDRLKIDFSFDPKKIHSWYFYEFKNKWVNLLK